MPIARPRLLGPEVFDRPADRVARELLGQWLVVRGEGGSQSRQMIFETEAYLGAHDLAYHRSRGLTPRNAAMFGPAGHSYLYLCYGLHWMLNRHRTRGDSGGGVGAWGGQVVRPWPPHQGTGP